MGADEVSRLLACCSTGGVNLLELGFNPGEWDVQVQQDSAEFTAEILAHFKPPGIHLGWEKRISVGSQGETLGRNESGVPVFLRLGKHPSSLQSLIDQWTQDENAVAAFQEASTYKVFQLDRMQPHQGDAQKLQTALTVEEQVQIPCFVDDVSATYELLNYDVIGVIFHTGFSKSGHLRAGLRAGPPNYWMSTDDGRVACLQPHLLQDIAKEIVQIWLVKSTAMRDTETTYQPVHDTGATDCCPHARP